MGEIELYRNTLGYNLPQLRSTDEKVNKLSSLLMGFVSRKSPTSVESTKSDKKSSGTLFKTNIRSDNVTLPHDPYRPYNAIPPEDLYLVSNLVTNQLQGYFSRLGKQDAVFLQEKAIVAAHGEMADVDRILIAKGQSKARLDEISRRADILEAKAFAQRK